MLIRLGGPRWSNFLLNRGESRAHMYNNGRKTKRLDTVSASAISDVCLHIASSLVHFNVGKRSSTYSTAGRYMLSKLVAIRSLERTSEFDEKMTSTKKIFCPRRLCGLILTYTAPPGNITADSLDGSGLCTPAGRPVLEYGSVVR